MTHLLILLQDAVIESASAGSLLPWVLTGVTSIIGALASVIAKMYHSRIKDKDKSIDYLRAKADELEDKNDSLHSDNKEMAVEMITAINNMTGFIERVPESVRAESGKIRGHTTEQSSRVIMSLGGLNEQN